jgi:two-component system response regulator NreC
VVIADDHALLRAGLRMLIDAQTDMQVVGEAGDPTTAIRKAREMKPDIVLLDISMPGGGGIGAIEELVRRVPRSRVLVLTMHDERAYVDSALAAGAVGYVVKKAADTELLSAIRAVHHGRIFVDASGGGPARSVRPPKRSRVGGLLSPREREVLELLARGYTNRQVAARMRVSVKSAETYRARLMKKLNLNDRSDLVRFALQAGFLRPEPTAR